MAIFHYNAINSKGKNQSGIVEAESLKSARQLLREKNMTLLSIRPAQEKAQKKTGNITKFSLSSKELALITRQLATLLTAGLPIEAALAAVVEQTEKPTSKTLLSIVRNKMLEGYSLAASLRECPAAFSELYCGTVAAGEQSGHLDRVLQRLADYTEQQFHMRQKLQHAFIYPSIMILVSIGIIGFLLEYVVPKMITVYSNIGQALPEMTQILLALSGAVTHYGLYIVVAIFVAGFLFFRKMKKSISFREKVHHLYLYLPIIGNAIKVVNTARFSRTFAILSSAGVSVLEAMTIASQLVSHLPIRYSVIDAVKRVREGAAIHFSLKQTRYFSPMSIHLMASGEASGQLEKMLEHAAANQEGEITRLIETSLALFEPVIILVMGAVVLFIVLAILLPIFQLDQLAG
jgi:general secretion pathway protein F